MARTEDQIIITPGEKFLLKDHLFNKKKIQRLAEEIAQAYPELETTQFVDSIVNKFPDLELKARINYIAQVLHETLPQDYGQALDIILDALPPALDTDLQDDDFGDFLYEPFNTYIAQQGCSPAYISKSLDALEQTTQRFSAEFALRFFIKFDEVKTFEKVHKWSKSSNYHVRRLSSEGIRPNLPWGGKIQTNPEKIIQVLDNLYYDSTRYVVRSVANNLNDISKTNYLLVLQTLIRWRQEDKQTQSEFEYLVRHALRSQIKAGESTVMQFLGYEPEIDYSLAKVSYKSKIALGEKQIINFILTAGQAGKYLIDYVVFFLKKDGTLSGKTFKIKDVFLEKGQSLHVEKKHPFRVMSTKQLYSGQHAWCLQVNGKQGKKHLFDLQV